MRTWRDALVQDGRWYRATALRGWVRLNVMQDDVQRKCLR